MKMLKRCWVSLKRHPFQTGLKIMIVFILGNFLFAAIAVQQASMQIRERMVQRIPADVTMQLVNDDMNRITEEKPKALIEELKENDKVLNVYSQATMNLPIFNEEVLSKSIFSSSDISTYYLTVGLTDSPETIFDYEFVEGRHLTQEEIDNGEAKAVLHETFAIDFNGKSYRVGDIISLPVYGYIIDHQMPDIYYMDFEVVGIVADYALDEAYQSGGKLPKTPMIEMPIQKLYEMRSIQDASLEEFSLKEQNRIKSSFLNIVGIRLKPLVSYIRIAIKGMDEVNGLLEDLHANPNYLSGYYATTTSADDYRYVQAPLENLVQLANITLWGSAIFVVVLLSLISMFFMRERIHEIGILMSMGERKIKIIGQFVLEIVLAGMLAVSVAMISGNALGRIISEQFLKIQVDVDSEQDYLYEHPEAVTQLDLLEDYEVTLNADYVITIFLSSTAILLISSALPVIYVLQIKPKKVLM